MKTTLDLNDVLIGNAKILAVQQRTTLTRIVEEGLRLRLDKPTSGKPQAPFRFPVMKGKGGLAPGIDPCSNSSLLDAAEGDGS